MSRRLAVPWGGLVLAILTLGIAVGSVALSQANHNPFEVAALAVFTFLAFPAMGLLILRHRPGHPIGYLLLGIGVNIYITFAAQDYARFALRHPGTLPFEAPVAWISGWNWIPFALMVLLFLPLLFPNGHLLSRRWWIVVGFGLAFALLAFVGNAFVPGPSDSTYPDVINPLGIKGHQQLFIALQNLAAPFGLIAMIGSITSVAARYRRADGVQRHQLRWFLFALVLATIPFIIQGSVSAPVAQATVAICIPMLPVSIAVAVLRYRLYDIDVVINRALVYATLAAFITAVYVAIVVGLGTLFGAANRANILLSILATAIVAIAFQPFHARVQRLANRLVYGKRATPYEVMAGFARQMSSTLALDDVLPGIAEVAARGVNAFAARALVFLPDGSQRASLWPAETESIEDVTRVPVQYKSDTVGQIEVQKPRGEAVNRSEQKLLQDLAAQTGLVLHNLRLAAELEAKLKELTTQAGELRASRQRIVTAQERERQRIGDLIGSTVQAQLEAIGAQLPSAVQLLDGDAADAATKLNALAGITQTALDSLRELARGIFPPILSDKGLVAALQAQLRKADALIELEAPMGMETRRFDSKIETAVYFMCIEAVRRATPATSIRLAEDSDTLRFSISGLSSNGQIQDSCDRIAAVGGSLRVNHEGIEGYIPIHALADR